MSENLDFKNKYSDLYLPPRKPIAIEVPPILFIMVDGNGAPESDACRNTVGVLYALAYAIKMKGQSLKGYFTMALVPSQHFKPGKPEQGVAGVESERKFFILTKWHTRKSQP